MFGHAARAISGRRAGRFPPSPGIQNEPGRGGDSLSAKPAGKHGDGPPRGGGARKGGRPGPQTPPGNSRPDGGEGDAGLLLVERPQPLNIHHMKARREEELLVVEPVAREGDGELRHPDSWGRGRRAPAPVEQQCERRKVAPAEPGPRELARGVPPHERRGKHCARMDCVPSHWLGHPPRERGSRGRQGRAARGPQLRRRGRGRGGRRCRRGGGRVRGRGPRRRARERWSPTLRLQGAEARRADFLERHVRPARPAVHKPPKPAAVRNHRVKQCPEGSCKVVACLSHTLGPRRRRDEAVEDVLALVGEAPPPCEGQEREGFRLCP